MIIAGKAELDPGVKEFSFTYELTGLTTQEKKVRARSTLLNKGKAA